MQRRRAYPVENKSTDCDAPARHHRDKLETVEQSAREKSPRDGFFVQRPGAKWVRSRSLRRSRIDIEARSSAQN